MSLNTLCHLLSDNLENCGIQTFQTPWITAFSAAYIYLYLQQVKVLCTSLSIVASRGSSYADERGCIGFLYAWRKVFYHAEVYVEMFYLCYISVTAGYHASPHPLQLDLDLGVQM